MGVKCDIKLDRQSYFPGQNIHCEVYLDFEEAKKIRGISVRFKGECNTKWTRGAGKSSVTYSADEEYFRTYIYVVGEKDGHEIEHPAGNHKYPVQFTLPANLPSSYIGRHGYIRYMVKVHVDVAWKFDSKFYQEFNVVAPIDLNHYPKVQNALRVEHSKQFTCFGCIPTIGGPYDIAISLPCVGYSNEQKIPITIEATNYSNVYIRGLKIALRKLITYHSTTPHKESKRDDIKLSVIKFAISIDKQQTKQFTGEVLVPSSTALNLDHCKLIEVSHRLEVASKLTGCRSNFVFDVPVTIGHFPYVNHPCSTLPHTNNGSDNGCGGGGGGGGSDDNYVPTISPPTYEMAMLTAPPSKTAGGRPQ